MIQQVFWFSLFGFMVLWKIWKDVEVTGGQINLTLTKRLVYQQIYKTFTPSLLPSTYPFFLYITVQFGTQLLLFSLFVYFKCHKSSRILSLLSVNKLLSFSEIRLSTTETKTECVRMLKVHQLVPTNIEQ